MTGIAGGQWVLNELYVMADIPHGVCLTTYNGGGGEFERTPFEEIVRLVEEGDFKVPIGKVLKLEDVVEAHQLMEDGKAGGKIVLMM